MKKITIILSVIVYILEIFFFIFSVSLFSLSLFLAMRIDFFFFNVCESKNANLIVYLFVSEGHIRQRHVFCCVSI